MGGFDWFVQQLPRCLGCMRPFIPQAAGDYACLPCRGVRFGEPSEERLTHDDKAVGNRLLAQVFFPEHSGDEPTCADDQP
jgi:hypothetical protein